MNTASEMAKRAQEALNQAMIKAGVGGLVTAYRVEGCVEGDRECLWLDSEYERLAPRAVAFLAAYLAKHMPGVQVTRETVGDKRAWWASGHSIHAVRRGWQWSAAQQAARAA